MVWVCIVENVFSNGLFSWEETTRSYGLGAIMPYVHSVCYLHIVATPVKVKELF